MTEKRRATTASSALGVGEYVGLPPLETVEEIEAWLSAVGIGYRSLGTNFAGQPLLCIERGGGSGRPLVITAGAHAGEPAGVLAALLLARDYAFDGPTYIVPLRDPFAWQAYASALSMIAGATPPAIHDHQSAEAAILAVGTEILRADDLVLADVNDVVFATMPPSVPPIGPRQVEQAVNRALLQQPDVARRLIGRRIVFPSISGPLAEGVGDYERSFSATIRGTGIVADMNRGFGGSEEPPEVSLLRQLVDELEPSLVLDLHEGQGSTYYVFVGADSPHPATTSYARAALVAMGADGDDPVTLDDLERAFGLRIREGLVEPEPGMMVGRVQNLALDGTSFGNYCDRYCPAITTETGRWAPLADRVRWQLAAARAVLEAHAPTGR